MIPDNVTLVVKAPNQQIEDQSIECLSSWTVKQLKGHLSEVYPSKPTTDEQKIIYSGQLLDDNAVLKDVLRTYESLAQYPHTMHLVCTPKRRPAQSGDAGGLRRRNVESPPTTNNEGPPRPEIRQNDQNHTAESLQRYLQSAHYANGGAPPPAHYGAPGVALPAHYGAPGVAGAALPTPTDAASMHHHVLMMQQAYMQYMQQYAHMWQAGGNFAPGAQPMNVGNEGPQPPAEAAAPAEEPEEVRRDWLDHLYAVSRLIVLVSLVHLYSSFYRLLLVLLLCIAAYLHQIGFFRDLGANHAAEEVPPRDEAPANDANAHANAANVTPTPPATPPPNDDRQQSLLAVTWMIFSSFFASLIPEINN